MKILLVGASSTLGRAVIPHLVHDGWQVKAMTRNPPTLEHLASANVEVVTGDLRDPASIYAALRDCSRVVYAAHALTGTGSNSSEAVDLQGVRTLIDAARAASIEQFVFTSAWGSDPRSPVDFMRYKAAGEAYLRASGLSWTILRPAAFMEFWVNLLAEPLLSGRPVMLFGRGVNLINYVSVEDVARVLALTLRESALRGEVINVAGPANYSVRDVIGILEQTTGRTARVRQVPLLALRVMSVVMRPVNRPLARLAALSAWQDTADMRLECAYAVSWGSQLSTLRTLHEAVAELAVGAPTSSPVRSLPDTQRAG